jgi:POT family proton-dependent oligopeptide transporter
LLYTSRWLAGETRKIPSQQLMELIMFIASGVLIFDLLMRSTAMSVTFMIGLSCSLFIYTFISMIKLNTVQRKQLLTCLALTTFSIICFTLTQQSAMSLTVFADNNVNRMWNGYSIPTFYFLALNPLLIIMLTPILASVWRKMDERGNNPSIAVKFAIGTTLLGLGFLILTEGIELNETTAARINLMWLVSSYFFQTLGELFICPVGLAMITELAPRQMIGFMIGAWYFAMAVATWLAGIAANYTVTLHHPSTHHHASLALTAYSNVFGSLGFVAITAGLILLLFTQTVNKLLNQR